MKKKEKIQNEETQSKPMLVLCFAENKDVSDKLAELALDFEVEVLQANTLEYHKVVFDFIKNLAENEVERAVIVAKHEYLPEKNHLLFLARKAGVLDFGALTGRKDLSYVNNGGTLYFPYPAVTGNELLISSPKMLKNIKFYAGYTQDLFLQITMQVSGKKAYIYEQTVLNVETKTEKTCKVC